MKTIKAILGAFVLTAFMTFTAFGQEGSQEDVKVKTEIETETGEQEYEYKKDVDSDGEVKTEEEYYGSTDTENEESETEFERNSKTQGDASNEGLSSTDQQGDRSQEGAANQDTKMDAEMNLETETSEGLSSTDYDDTRNSETEFEQDTEYEQDTELQQDNSQGISQSGETGTSQEMRTEVAEEALPEKVTAKIEQEHSDKEISRAFEISKGGEIVYEIEFENANGETETEKFKEDGTVVDA